MSFTPFYKLKKNPFNDSEYSKEYKEVLKKVINLPSNRENIQKEFNDLLKKNQIILVVGETGSGKTTQIPKQVLHFFNYEKNVVCTQPRTLAASGVAQRVAVEMDVEVGKEVGYHFRHNKMVNKEVTKLSFITDGILLIKSIVDPELKEYSSIIIDEAHEQSVNVDMILSALKELILSGKRPDLKIIIMSATMDPSIFRNYFKETKAKIGDISISGRTFPVTAIYSPSEVKDYLGESIARIVKICNDPRSLPGDILVFITSKPEAEEGIKQLRQAAKHIKKYKIKGLALYSGIYPEEQEYATHIDKYKTMDSGPYERKIVFSTNLAETSVTIDGVVYVIDSGMSWKNKYIPKIRGSSLKKGFISQASSKQRLGRAGRTQRGIGYLLYTEKQFSKFDKHNAANIITDDITPLLLQLLATTNDIKKLNKIITSLINPPSVEKVTDSMKTLYRLGAIDKNSQITELGRAMNRFPMIEPEISRMIIAGLYYDCIDLTIELGAILSNIQKLSDCFIVPSDFKLKKTFLIKHSQWQNKYGDHIALLKLYHQFREVKAQGLDVAKDWCNKNFINFKKLMIISKFYRTYKRILETIQKEHNITEKDFVMVGGKSESIIKTPLNSENIKKLLRCIYVAYYYNKITLKKKKDSYSIWKIKKYNKEVFSGFNMFGKNPPDSAIYTYLTIMNNNNVEILSTVS